jgi:hypothetical protein
MQRGDNMTHAYLFYNVDACICALVIRYVPKKYLSTLESNFLYNSIHFSTTRSGGYRSRSDDARYFYIREVEGR